MGTFAVAASPETIDRGTRLLASYAKDGEKKEETLLRIFDVAEAQQIRGTHPELAPVLKAVDQTINTLARQIDGIVAGQDQTIESLKKKLNEAIEAKTVALADAKEKTEAADAKMNEAEEKVKYAQEDALVAINEANAGRDQALRELEDARVIAKEKTASNELLLKQMASMEDDLKQAKEMSQMLRQRSEELNDLKVKYTLLENNFELQNQIHAAALDQLQAELENVKKLSEVENARIKAEYELMLLKK